MSYLNRVPSNFMMKYFSEESRLTNLRVQDKNHALLTGCAAYNWSDAPNETKGVLSEHCALLTIQSKIDNIDHQQANINQTHSLLEQMKSVLIDFRGLCIQANNSANTAHEAISLGSSVLKEQFIGLINTKDYQGHYLFSGPDTNKKPVDMEQYRYTPDLSKPNHSYYCGQESHNKAWPSARDPFVEKALRAFQGLESMFSHTKEGTSVAFDYKQLEEIIFLTGESFADLNERSSIFLGGEAKTLSLQQTHLNNGLLVASERFEQLGKTNLASAVPEQIMAQQQSSLSMIVLNHHISQISMYAKRLLLTG